MEPAQPTDEPKGERRAPIVVALLVAAGLPLLMPQHLLPVPSWVEPAILGALLVAMVTVDPGRIDERSRPAHYCRIAIVFTLIFGTAWVTAVLTRDLIYGNAAITNSGPELLRAGGLVWVSQVITFAFLYWEVDLGGPGQRAHKERQYPDLAFPQDLNHEVRRPGWRPVFTDYLYLGLTNGLAFSPTDTIPIASWAKLAMGIQSIASLSILGLVIARAVNIFK